MSTIKKRKNFRNIDDLSKSEIKNLLNKMGMSLDRSNRPKSYYVDLYNTAQKAKHKVTRDDTSFAFDESTLRKRRRSQRLQSKPKFEELDAIEEEDYEEESTVKRPKKSGNKIIKKIKNKEHIDNGALNKKLLYDEGKKKKFRVKFNVIRTDNDETKTPSPKEQEIKVQTFKIQIPNEEESHEEDIQPIMPVMISNTIIKNEEIENNEEEVNEKSEEPEKSIKVKTIKFQLEESDDEEVPIIKNTNINQNYVNENNIKPIESEIKQNIFISKDNDNSLFSSNLKNPFIVNVNATILENTIIKEIPPVIKENTIINEIKPIDSISIPLPETLPIKDEVLPNEAPQNNDEDKMEIDDEEQSNKSSVNSKNQEIEEKEKKDIVNEKESDNNEKSESDKCLPVIQNENVKEINIQDNNLQNENNDNKEENNENEEPNEIEEEEEEEGGIEYDDEEIEKYQKEIEDNNKIEAQIDELNKDKEDVDNHTNFVDLSEHNDNPQEPIEVQEEIDENKAQNEPIIQNEEDQFEEGLIEYSEEETPNNVISTSNNQRPKEQRNPFSNPISKPQAPHNPFVVIPSPNSNHPNTVQREHIHIKNPFDTSNSNQRHFYNTTNNQYHQRYYINNNPIPVDIQPQPSADVIPLATSIQNAIINIEESNNECNDIFPHFEYHSKPSLSNTTVIITSILSALIILSFIFSFNHPDTVSSFYSSLNFNYVLLFLLIILLIAYIIYKIRAIREFYTSIANDDFARLKKNLHNIRLSNDNNFDGVIMNEFVIESSAIHNISIEEYKRNILPILREMISKDRFIIETNSFMRGEFKVVWKEL